MTVNDKLRNTTIQHAHFIEQYKNHEIKKVLALLNKSDNSLRDQLKKYKGKTDTITSKRLKLMRQDIKDIVGESKQVLSTKIDDLAVNFGNLESKWLGDIIHDAVPNEVPISFIQPSPTQILAAVKATPFNNTTLQDMITTWSTSKIKLFTNATQQAFIQGQGIDDVVRILFGTRALQYTDGLVDGTRRQIRTQVRTAMNHFSSTARDLTYKQNSDLIKGVQWVATLDGRTTLQCINLDGKVDYEDGSRRELNGLRPPAHYNCRSTTVPVIKSLKELGLSDKEFSSSTRASMNGQVPETKKYKDWFKDQPAAFQQQVLGKKRYDLYKKGEFTFDKFVENGQELTIDQLSMIGNTDVPTVAPFVEAKSIKEAEQWAYDTLGVRYAGYNGANINAVNEMNRSIYDNFTRFPELKDTFGDVGVAQNLEQLYAERSASWRMKNLSKDDKRFFKRFRFNDIQKRKYLEDMYKKSHKNVELTFIGKSYNKTAPDGTRILNGVGMNKKFMTNSPEVKRIFKYDETTKFHPVGTGSLKGMVDHEMGHEIDKLLGRVSQTQKFDSIVKKYNIADDLSRYPVTYRDKSTVYKETFAEAWSEYLNNPTPRPLAKEIGDLAMEEYKNKFGGK
jgi:SPP1 gp7 family putative phage head morphogenesis protein